MTKKGRKIRMNVFRGIFINIFNANSNNKYIYVVIITIITM